MVTQYVHSSHFIRILLFGLQSHTVIEYTGAYFARFRVMFVEGMVEIVTVFLHSSCFFTVFHAIQLAYNAHALILQVVI